MKLLKLSAFIFFTFFNALTYAFEVRLQPEMGYDTNPLSLADRFNVTSSLYFDANARLRYDFDKYRIEGRVYQTHYFSEENANTNSYYVSGRYRTTHKMFDLKTRSQVIFRYRNSDKTFVSKNTGEVATFAGESIADRYDRTEIEVYGNSKIYLNKRVDTRIRYSLLTRDYKDFAIVGLSNFDYTLWEVSNEWVYAPNKAQEFFLELGLGLRDYDNKAQRELTGATIENTNLRYNSNNITAQYSHALSNNIEIELAHTISEQRDNGSGYYDFNNNETSVAVSYINTHKQRYNVKIKQLDKQFLNSPEFDLNNDGEPSKKGYMLELAQQRDIALASDSAKLTTGISYDNIDSNQANYNYNRLKLFASFVKEY